MSPDQITVSIDEDLWGRYVFEREAVLGYRDAWQSVIFPLTLALGALATSAGV